MHKIEMVAPNKLKPRPDNRNKHPDDQIDRLVKVIEYQGFRRPIIVSNQSGQIVCGHGRLLAAKRLKLKQVPVIYQDYTSPEQEYADHVADNAIAEWADLDLSAINTDLANLGEDFDIELLGIKQFSLDPDFAAGSEADQGQLDQKKFQFYLCPHCEEKFELGQATHIKD